MNLVGKIEPSSAGCELLPHLPALEARRKKYRRLSLQFTDSVLAGGGFEAEQMAQLDCLCPTHGLG